MDHPEITALDELGLAGAFDAAHGSSAGLEAGRAGAHSAIAGGV